MRVLVKDGAERISSETILILPEGRCCETVLGTLSGGGYSGPSFVADVIELVVERVITDAVRRRSRRVTSRELYRDVRWMARLLDPYLIGSPIRLHVDGWGCHIDASRATLRAGPRG